MLPSRRAFGCVAFTLVLGGVAASVLAQSGDPKKEVPFRDLHRGGSASIVGHFGLPIGKTITLEGKRAPNLKTTNAATLEVTAVSGRALPKDPNPPWPPHIQIDNVDALPEDQKIVVEGYEFARWTGNPDINWHIEVDFVISKVIEPVSLVLKKDPYMAAPPQRVVVTDLSWWIEFDASGAAHAQYGSLPEDGGSVPAGTVAYVSLLKALSQPRDREPPPGRFQIAMQWPCAEGRPAQDCSSVARTATDYEQDFIQRLLVRLDGQWQSSLGGQRFRDLLRRYPLVTKAERAGPSLK